jgi:hypothetical protein
VDNINFYETEISNKNPKDIRFTVSTDNNMSVESQIETINAQIDIISSDMRLVEEIEKRATSKGVY